MTEKKKPKKLFSWLWGLWVAAFAIIEYFGIKTGGGNTLSARAIKFIRHNKLTYGLFGVFMAWLFYHWSCQ